MDIEQLAKEAYRLLNDETLAWAMTEVRTQALAELAEVEATNANEIRRLQAIAGCLQGVRDKLEAVILATGQMDGGVSANGPTGNDPGSHLP